MNNTVIKRRRSEGKCAHCETLSVTYLCDPCNITRKQQHKMFRADMKQQAVDAYGGKCACCGDARIYYLQIDHINGGGNAHRRELGMTSNSLSGTYSGYQFYMRMKKLGWPPILQVLCANCHNAKT